jgi:pimeloyl-ACP methyl ester carboxylesterase
MKALIYIGAILLFLIIIVFIISFFFFKYAAKGRRLNREKALNKAKRSRIYSPYCDKIAEGMDWILANTSECVSTASYDKLKLTARRIKAKENNENVIIMFHGWTSISFFDFSCIVKVYHEMGYDVLLVDQRAHGDSEGKYTTFGVKERYDVLSWINYAIDLYGENVKIVIEGISMGASTVLMASGLSLPANVVGVIADCGFTSAADEFTHVLKRDYKMKPFPFLYTANIVSRMVAGFGFWDINAEDEVKKSELPLLLLHGKDDDFVPVEFSRRIYSASNSKNKKLIEVENARHGLSYFNDEEGCKTALSEFLFSVFGK